MTLLDEVKEYSKERGGERSWAYLVGMIQGRLRRGGGLTEEQAEALADEIEEASHFVIWGK